MKNLASAQDQAQTAEAIGSREVAARIDHTLLKADATPLEIEILCDEAIAHGFAGVCVNSAHIPRVAEKLQGTGILPVSVVGFPLGAAATSSKAYEAKEAVSKGAHEIDMVIAIGELKSKNYGYVLEDIRQVVEASRPYPVKVILETHSLTQSEKVIACALSKAAGAAFVKTSTGFGGGGATVEDVTLMRDIVGGEMGVKASGGVRSLETAIQMIRAGADRLGTSSGVSIVTQGRAAETSY